MKPELLAPAGDWDCAKAAVANGADAIYFGLPAFNARMRATNFTPDDLPRLMEFLHAHNVKGYVAFNVLIFTDELAAAEEELRLLARAGVDAAIVQDLGLVSLAREVAPSLPLHASTQMTLTSPEGVAFARKHGVSLAVLARELSLRELAKFREEPLPLEVFVHGALCVAYSGQCLTSEALGQRSANRGECAQACRLPYEMIVDGVKRDLGDKRYLLSPQDLAAVEQIPELIKLGIASFKIEGRLKTPEYVAAVTQVYRRAIDSAAAAIAGSASSPNGAKQVSPGQRPGFAPKSEPSPEGAKQSGDSSASADRYKLEMAFSRGLYSGWMHGVNHQELVHARYGKKRGAFLGTIAAVGRSHLELKLQDAPVHPGDGIVIDQGGDTDQEQGGRVYEVEVNPQRDGIVRLAFEHGKIDFRALHIGDRIWKTDDPQLNRELRKSWTGEIPLPRRTLDFVITGRAGSPLKIEARCGDAREFIESSIPLEVAQKRPLTDDTLRAQLGRLGETDFVHGMLENKLEGEVILPLSELNRLRRDVAGKVAVALRATEDQQIASSKTVARSATATQIAPRRLSVLNEKRAGTAKTAQPLLTTLCRTLDQIEVALRLGLTEIYADFEDIRRYKDAVELVRAHGGAQILLATPRIQKAGEQGFFKLIENAQPDGVLIRNLGALQYFSPLTPASGGPGYLLPGRAERAGSDAARPFRRIGDFSLNVANPLTAELLMAEKLERLTVSYDLNAGQVLDLLRAAPPAWFEITLHQHIPMFHMEHCVFAAFLSNGTDYTNCGRPCDTHRVELRDRVGLNHPLKADVGCRNTLFHAQAQSGAAYFDAFARENPAAFRIELLLEDAADSERTLRGYQRLLAGEITGPALIRELNLRSQLGVTTGTLAAK